MNFAVWNSILVIALSTALLFHFVLIGVLGSFLIQEPNKVILMAEITLLLGCLIFGIIGLIKEVKL